MQQTTFRVLLMRPVILHFTKLPLTGIVSLTAGFQVRVFVETPLSLIPVRNQISLQTSLCKYPVFRKKLF